MQSNKVRNPFTCEVGCRKHNYSYTSQEAPVASRNLNKQGRVLPIACERSKVLPTPLLWTSGLQNCVEMPFSCLKSPSVW